MKYRLFALCASLLLSSAAISDTYLGQQVIEVSFQVDGGKTITLPMTKTGAMPIENDDYKIEGAGFNISLDQSVPEKSTLDWAFSFVAKKSGKLKYVSVEQVESDGRLTLLIKDEAPALNAKSNWVGHAAPKAAAKDVSPWLYSREDTTLMFKFTITAESGSSVTMYQPSVFSSKTKKMLLFAMGIRD